MFRMTTDRGLTAIKEVKSGRTVYFDKLTDAIMYIGIMKDIYYRKATRRTASEPYPVRTLCLGNYPVRVIYNNKKQKGNTIK